MFSQGRTITSCLTREGPHLNEKGESICTICAKGSRSVITLPLLFCRSCGQEYYGATLLDDKSLLPRDIEMVGTEGRNIYILKGDMGEEITYYPDEWLDNNSHLKSDKKSLAAHVSKYCIDCNKIDDANCPLSDKVDVVIVPFPFLFCPVCKVSYDRHPREFNKLFTFEPH